MDDDSNSNLLEKIIQYQNSIIKHSEKGNDERILYYIKKLYDMPVTVEHLKQTGIGRTMNSLRKYSGDVGVASKTIVSRWKTMVSTEEDEGNTKPSTPPPPEDSDSSSESSLPPPSIEKPKIKSEKKEETYSKREESREKSSSKRHDSSERSSSKSKSEDRHSSKSHHRKEEKRDSHKSSHKEKEHKSRHESDKHRREEKPRHENKRKHEEERIPSKKLRYEDNNSDSEDSNRLQVQDALSESPIHSDDNILPDSTTNHEDSRENTQSPIEKPDHKKHHKSDKNEKHRSRDKERKEMNGSSKKSSHRDRERHSSESKKEKSSPSKDAKPSSSTKNKSKKRLIDADNGIDSGSGASFAEALGMIEPTKSSKTTFKKKGSSTSASPTPTPSTSTIKPSKPTTPKPRTLSPLTQNPNLLSPLLKLEPLDTTIVSQLPEITTNYKPLGLNYEASPYGNVKQMSEEEALSVVISSKTQRTKVYSGVKTNWGYVPSLFQLCVRILQDNIDALEYTGGVPYEILKPVLERATANQLLNAEYYNPYLIEETDELWESHCKRECKGLKRQEMETCREMWLRCRDERDAKLKALTVNIKQSIDKSLPVRQTKLAYVDSVVKPPRGVARKQAKYGTSDNHKKPLITPTQRLNAIASGSGEKISVPNPGPRAVSSSASSIKPKKAPLMQKTLALMKGRFGRR